MKENKGEEKIEYILCAAIWCDDGIVYAKQPSNIDTGLVFCGWRHGCIFPQISGVDPNGKSLYRYQREQGFLTNKNRFVSRTDAAAIAFKAGQINRVISLLYTEDLY